MGVPFYFCFSSETICRYVNKIKENNFLEMNQVVNNAKTIIRIRLLVTLYACIYINFSSCLLSINRKINITNLVSFLSIALSFSSAG